jgi:hypothetical protein
MNHQRLQTVHDFAADNSFRYYQGLDGKTPGPFNYLTDYQHISWRFLKLHRFFR